MAVSNTLTKAPVRDKAIEYEVNGQIVKLSPSIIKNYLVNGNGNVSDQEVVMFLNLCKFNRLNPFLGEAYLIKYGNSPATMVVGRDAIAKRAMRNPNYAGQQAGVVVLKKDGQIENRIGSIVLPDEDLVGGWATVYVKGYEHPVEMTVSFNEYCQEKDGKPTANWATKPGTMIRKVALVQALREAFPEDLEQMYTADERGLDETALDIMPVSPAEPPARPLVESSRVEDTKVTPPNAHQETFDDFFDQAEE